MQNETSSGRLTYSSLSETDLNDLYVCLSDPQITQSIYWLNTPFTQNDAAILIRRAIDEQEGQSNYWLATRRKIDGQYVGNINIHRKLNGEAEIGYWIAQNFWNNGYATEMVEYAVSLIAEMNDIQAITATTAINNLGSQAVLKKNGFRFEEIVQSSASNNEVRESKLFKLSV